MMFVQALAALLCSTLSRVDATQQKPLKQQNAAKIGVFDLIYELKKAEIIPTVIDAFTPLLSINISWSNATAGYGNTIDPSETQEEPDVLFTVLGSDSIFASKDKSPQLTLALTDPDAPSRENPEWSEICHWIATSISATSSSLMAGNKDLKQVMPYKPPGPPPKTGKHRYIFVALAPLNGTTDELFLEKPADRQHWGFENERQGLRLWAEEMGLGVIGANFIYEQNDEQ